MNTQDNINKQSYARLIRKYISWGVSKNSALKFINRGGENWVEFDITHSCKEKCLLNSGISKNEIEIMRKNYGIEVSFCKH